MSGPWTVAEAASEAVSKKMLLAHMQENCSAEFLSQHKLNGQPNQVLKRLTKDAMIVAYKAAIGESGESAPAPKAAAGGPTFKFEPPAAVEPLAAAVDT